MPIELRYGRSGLDLELPPDLDARTLHLNPLPPLEDADEAIRDSFENPIDCLPLRELARGKRSACIVICDVTRPVPNEAILRPMVQILEEEGIGRESIIFLIATGLHRPNVGEELREMVGSYLFENYRFENHDARNDEEMAELGEVGFGEGQSARVALNSHYIDAELKITTGLLEPHFMAGYSGGRKVICPGIASAKTILQFHSPPMIGNPNARAGNLVANPIHAMSLAVAKQVGCDFICNVTLDEERRITGVFSGDMVGAHRKGIEWIDQSNKVQVEPAPIVVTTSAGYPLDTTFYQIAKGMVCALPALEKGGTLIIAASLSEGIGGPEFTEMCQSLTTVDEFLERIFSSPTKIDQWQLQEMMLALQHASQILIVSDGLSPETLDSLLLSPVPSVEVALEIARQKHGADARAIIIPEGPYVTPVAHTA
ncbi:nickel-dependent lactate racemase [bacterium]|nr:MAG: nickel-dependent lactate racemase [bacterium]